jgi:signal transduction histidine kinase
MIWAIPFWNAMVRLGFFLIVVFSLAMLRRSRERQEDLMAFVIHDLRAPLGNMLTALDMLQTRDTAENQNSTWRELINLGLSSGQRMLNLVDSLLDLSRLESGKLEVQREAVLITHLFAESIAQVVLTAEFKQVTIHQSVDSAGTAAYADPSLTQRVLVNLLNNAIKFSPQAGTIILQAATDQKDEVIIAVRDEGAGIPVEWQQRVFAKYGQVSGGQSGGSGLGLTFCKLAVEAQDGRIWLESDTGSGTTIHFSLPKVR